MYAMVAGSGGGDFIEADGGWVLVCASVLN